VDDTTPTAATENQVSQVEYRAADVPELQPLAERCFVARGADPPDSVPPPVGGAPSIPPPGGEPYNPGVVTDRPLGHSFWDKCKELFGGDHSSTCCHNGFQSDHAFDCLASPVSNPFLVEDPRALTEVRPIFIYQGNPHAAGGGYSGFFGTQARLAFNERWSVVMKELGFVWLHPNDPPDGLTRSTGFAQFTIGPKWTFYRNPDTSSLAAAGLDFQFPIGSAKVFQDTGNLTLTPYVSYGQSFRLGQGNTIDFIGSTGIAVSVDNQRSEYYYLSLHADYQIIHAIYPFLELNYFHYFSGGRGPALGFEGTDLFNFGSSNVGSRDFVTLAPGVRYKFSECIQAGFAVEFPLTRQKELTDYRLLFDVIFRF
jgi:hypothetical protein